MGRDRVIAVTGANGYIGSHVVKVLLARGYRVRAGVRLPHSEERVSHLRKLLYKPVAPSRLWPQTFSTWMT